MFRKLLLVFIALHVLTVAALAIVFPNKNEHGFIRLSHRPEFEKYYKRHWELLPPTDWGLEPNPPKEMGCGPSGGCGSGVRRFGFIGIVEEEGWQITGKLRE
ncbi:MAG: hypothetical protein QM758_01435 [Armatimonas sp.]